MSSIAPRIQPSAHPAALSDLVRVYVWEWPVRVTHWALVLSMTVLALTGLYMSHPLFIVSGPAGQHFTTGYIKVIHLYAATVFGLALVSRILWMFTGNIYSHWDKFIPVRRKRRQGLAPTLNFYLFRFRKPPGFVGHNPLAGLVYTAVYLLEFIMLGTGLALYSASARLGSPLRFFRFLIPAVGGLQHARWIHHGVMWALIGFAIHHVYSAILMSQIEGNGTMESIFSGYKFVHKDDVLYSGYRFFDKKDVEHGGH